MNGKVTVWRMTPEELEEYKRKHPIRPTQTPKNEPFDNLFKDFKWRPDKAVAASKKAREK